MTHVKASDLKTVRRKSVTNYLNKLVKSKATKEFLLTRDRRAIDAASWLDWFEEQQKIRQFSCTVAGAGGDGCIDIDQINDGCGQWNVPRSVSVARFPESIVAAILPLIVLSEQLTVVDQYFRLPSNPVLVELFNVIGITPIRSLKVVTSMETKDIQSVYDQTYRVLNGANVNFEWITAPTKYFHDRYVITDVGAVRSGQGFMADVEKGAHSDLANINIIGYEEASRTLSDLMQLLKDGRATLELSA